MGLGLTKSEEMEFPGLDLKQASGVFTKAAYGQRLTFEHP